MLRTTIFAVAVLAFSGVAQADTVKQIWNQGLGENNPGRIESPGDCNQDDSSAFSCWNDRSDVDSGSLGGAENGNGEEEEEESKDNV